NEKITSLSAADQHPAVGALGTGVRGSTALLPGLLAISRACSPAQINASNTPVLTARPPFVATSHQSIALLSNAFAELYAVKSTCLPSGAQIGYLALVKFGPTRCGWPPDAATTHTVPLPGTA